MSHKISRTQGRASTGRIDPDPRRLRLAALALLLVLSMATTLVLVACGDEQPAVPSGPPTISGVVKQATAGADGMTVASFLVTQGTGAYDKAMVSVGAGTAWYRAAEDRVEPIETPTAAALVGRRVDVQFTGPVAESYPVQATAGWVIVHQ